VVPGLAQKDVRDALVLFQHSERIKSFLIMASKMLDGLRGLEGAELSGAKRMFKHFLDALMTEVRIAQNTTGRQEFGDVNAMLSEVSNLAHSGLLDEAVRKVAEAISVVTTCGSEAYELLKREELI